MRVASPPSIPLLSEPTGSLCGGATTEKVRDKKYIENQYRLAVLDFQTARNEDEQWEARKTMARLEQIAAQEYGFEYADELHEKEIGRKGL